MKSYKTSIIALALMSAVAGQARAADEEVATPSYADLGFYLRGDIGWSFLEWSGDDSNAFAGGVGVGYQFTDYLRSDLRVDYAGVYTNGPDMSVTTALGNLYFDIPTGTVITPYLGAGAGYGWAPVDGGPDKDGFAYSLHGRRKLRSVRQPRPRHRLPLPVGHVGRVGPDGASGSHRTALQVLRLERESSAPARGGCGLPAITPSFLLLNKPGRCGIRVAGLALPTEGQSICKDGAQDDDIETGAAAGQPALFFRPLRQDPGLTP